MKNIEEIDFEKHIQINKYKIDEELEKQASLYIRWTKEYLVSIEEEYSKAKLNLKVIQAELDKEVRNDPKKYGIQKISESAVKSVIESDKRVIKAEKMVIKKKKELSIIQGALRALDHKKTSLENMTRLIMMGYFSTEPTTSLTKKILAESEEISIKNELNKKMKRRKK